MAMREATQPPYRRLLRAEQKAAQRQARSLLRAEQETAQRRVGGYTSRYWKPGKPHAGNRASPCGRLADTGEKPATLNRKVTSLILLGPRRPNKG